LQAVKEKIKSYDTVAPSVQIQRQSSSSAAALGNDLKQSEIDDKFSLQAKYLERLDTELKELTKFMSNYVLTTELQKEMADKVS
jgi:hypothetical protein